ncbi:DUF4167 domain-containing protein [Rhizorhabdus dicambivorans]|uniref:DUF4167 domain-containing protein n=1 Tax=Rhizorhabdus dicambivorans TaxID=1850238 RepID=UPI002F268818
MNRTTSDEDIGKLINNRQNGRRRGRGGGQGGAPRPGGSNGGQDRGNRIDNRARGNAAQLLEKYKALARDAQMQGDRVNTEYYLQFADHYFRVLSETRSRFEDQQPRPRRDEFAHQSDEDYGDEGDRTGNEDVQTAEPAYAAQDRAPRGDRPDRPDRGPRPGRVERADRGEHVEFSGNRAEPQQTEAESVEQAEPAEERRPRRGRQPRGEPRFEEATPVRAEQPVLFDTPEPAPAPAAEEEPRPVRRRGRPPKAQAAEQIEVDRLPPSLSLTTPVNDGDEPAARPRRTRKPRGESAAA